MSIRLIVVFFVIVVVVIGVVLLFLSLCYFIYLYWVFSYIFAWIFGATMQASTACTDWPLLQERRRMSGCKLSGFVTLSIIFVALLLRLVTLL